MPAGARISAGKFGSVDRSLPKDAVSEVKRSPVSCMPSPESPAKRMITRSRRRTSFTPAVLRCSPATLPSACSAGLLTWLVTELDLPRGGCLGAAVPLASQDQPYDRKGRLPWVIRMMDTLFETIQNPDLSRFTRPPALT
ncbi:hypothetical protein SALBM311S_06120 [Streptomyces alboniger]